MPAHPLKLALFDKVLSQVLLAFRAKYLEGQFLSRNLKTLDAGYAFFAPQTEAESWVTSQLYGTQLGVSFLARVCLSLSCLFYVGIFSFSQCVVAVHLVSGCAFGVSMERRMFRSLLCHHLGQLSKC